MFRPLEGVRVVELTQVLAGPYAGYQLALLGAEVIKVEMPGVGDWTRSKGGIESLNARNMGLTFLNQNADKKSLTLNIKSPEGQRLLKELVATADVFIENARPGTMARQGLDFASLREVKADLVYCSISAYGQDGAFSARGAYDHVVQGMCGIMGTTGHAGSGPIKVGAPYVDMATGLNAAYSILAGLMEVRRTGEAVHLDVAMLDTALLLMGPLVSNCLNTGWKPVAAGNEAWSRAALSGAFATADGTLMLAANTHRHMVRFCRAVGLPELAEHLEADPAAASGIEDLRARVAEKLAARTALDWETLLSEAGVPCGKVRSLDEILADDHIAARGVTRRLEADDTLPALSLFAAGFKANGGTMAPGTPPPQLGADTSDILSSLGVAEDQLEVLARDGVI